MNCKSLLCSTVACVFTVYLYGYWCCGPGVALNPLLAVSVGQRTLQLEPTRCSQRSARRRAVQQPECVVVLDHRGKTDANVLVETFELKNVQLAAHKFDHVEPPM